MGKIKEQNKRSRGIFSELHEIMKIIVVAVVIIVVLFITLITPFFIHIPYDAKVFISKMRKRL